ncbi:50S ribosomal protein L19e [Candidatus Woesearchaeota archaeon]|nr:50S ribosomal protein L19e [Candidatus Woesearchaeota archaeon]
MLQKRLASQILKCSASRIRFNPERLADIKEAITRQDVRSLIAERAITKLPAAGISRARIRFAADQRRKGRRKGAGSRKGSKTARLSGKADWIARIRLQRAFLGQIRAKGLVEKSVFNDLYRKAKGGFFRNRRHIKLYINEQKLFVAKK